MTWIRPQTPALVLCSPSRPEAGFKTEAKPNIWTDNAKFAAAAANFQTQAGKLQTVAAAGDVEAIKAQFRATGGTCKACHDVYRVEK